MSVVGEDVLLSGPEPAGFLELSRFKSSQAVKAMPDPDFQEPLLARGIRLAAGFDVQFGIPVP